MKEKENVIVHVMNCVAYCEYCNAFEDEEKEEGGGVIQTNIPLPIISPPESLSAQSTSPGKSYFES